MKQNKEFEFNFVDIVSLIWFNRTRLVLIGIISIVLSAVFSSPFFIKPKYKSEVIFYPTTINSIGNAMFTDLTQRQSDPLAFGEEEEAENALQLLNSSALQGRIVRNFDLMNHYRINNDGGSPQTDLAKEMNKNIRFSRTKHLAVNITVLDEDPIKSAEIANGIAVLFDSVKRLKELGQKGITNYEEQSRAISEELYKAVTPAKVKVLQAQQDELAKYAGEFTYLNETLILELESLSKLRKRFEKATVDVEKTLPQKFILTSATPAEKKSYPIRWLIVLGVTAVVMFFSVIVLVFNNQKNSLKK